MPWRRKWQPTPVFLPGKSHEQRSLVGYSPWGHKESDMTERLSTAQAFPGQPRSPRSSQTRGPDVLSAVKGLHTGCCQPLEKARGTLAEGIKETLGNEVQANKAFQS